MKRDWIIILALNAVLLANLLIYLLLNERDWQQTTAIAVLWGVHVPIAIATLIWLSRIIKRSNRQRKGLCPSCGYDIRASIDRCSECGAKIQRRDTVG